MIPKHIINTDQSPYIPNKDWKVEEHVKNGTVDVSKIALWFSEEQKKGYIEGNKLRKQIKYPLNANVLDHLLRHPEFIPEEWKGKAVYFWGTIYRDSDGDLYVRCLYWNDGQWLWYYGWLGHGWRAGSPAAVPASTLDLEPQASSDSLPLELTINGVVYIRKQ